MGGGFWGAFKGSAELLGTGSAERSVCISAAGGADGWAVWSGVGSRVLSKSNKPKGDMEKNLSIS